MSVYGFQRTLDNVFSVFHVRYVSYKALFPVAGCQHEAKCVYVRA